MDDIDRRILELLSRNARMPVKEIAGQIRLTSPAVSSRIRRLEEEGIIGGYTVVLHRPRDAAAIDALISVSAAPNARDELVDMLRAQRQVLQCYHVTGDHSFLVKVSCSTMNELEHLIMQFQKLGPTNTQIILSTPVDRRDPDLSAFDDEV